MKLVQIIDNGSPHKHCIAVQIVENIRNIAGCSYIMKINKEPARCQNFLKENACSKRIMDEFIILNDRGETLSIGNTCIARMVEKNLIDNLNIEQYKEIRKYIKNDFICNFCGKSFTKPFHKSCKKKCVFNAVLEQLIVRVLKDDIRTIFKNLYLISNNKFDARTIKSLKNFKNEYSMFFDNREKILSFKNNNLIDNIRKQKRLPSIKQTAIIEKIIDNYNRIKRIDSLRNLTSKVKTNYLKYGYVF